MMWAAVAILEEEAVRYTILAQLNIPSYGHLNSLCGSKSTKQFRPSF